MNEYETVHPQTPEAPKINEESPKPEENTHKSKKRAMLGVFFIVAVLIIYYQFTPPPTFTRGGIVTITPGESLKEVAQDLSSNGYIRSGFLFTNFVSFYGGENKISQGDYYFESPLTVNGVAWEIAKGQHHLEPLKITIPEGKNNTEIAQIFKSKLSAFNIETFNAKALEYQGYLFPETYFVYPRTDAITIINEMRDMYTKEAKPVIRKENKTGKSERDIVIMASLIEKEARGSDDRAVIAGILWNRIDREIPLQVDATVAFARGIPENALQKSDLAVDSPYNTYIYRGLPPGPISNPGILALEAAMNPAETPYLYYIHDKHGNIHYAKTYVDHQQNINTYLR